MSLPPIPIGTSGQATKRKWRPLLLRWLLCIALVLACLSGWAWWYANQPIAIRISPETTYVTSPLTPEGRVDFLAAINETMTVYPPEENAVPLLMRIVDWNEDSECRLVGERLAHAINCEFVDGSSDTVLISYRDYTEKIVHAAMEIDDPNSAEVVPARIREKPWSPAEFPLAAKWLVHIEPSLNLVHEAAKRPGYYRPIVFGEEGELINVLLIDLQAMRLAAKSLSCRVMQRIQSGEFASAVDDVGLIYQLGAWCGESPWLISQLIQASIYAMADLAVHELVDSGKLSESDVKRLQDHIFASPPLVALDQMLDIPARLMILQTLVKRHIEDHPRPEDSLWVRFNMRLVDWNLALAEVNKVYDELLPLVRLTDPRQFAVQKPLLLASLRSNQDLGFLGGALEGVGQGRAVASKKVGRKIATTTLPKFDDLWYSRRNRMMRKRLTLLTLGLVRYYQKHGSFPNDLSEVVEESLVSLPEDEIADVPIDYSNTKTEAVITVTGFNGEQVPDIHPGYFSEIEIKLPAQGQAH